MLGYPARDWTEDRDFGLNISIPMTELGAGPLQVSHG